MVHVFSRQTTLWATTPNITVISYCTCISLSLGTGTSHLFKICMKVSSPKVLKTCFLDGNHQALQDVGDLENWAVPGSYLSLRVRKGRQKCRRLIILPRHWAATVTGLSKGCRDRKQPQAAEGCNFPGKFTRSCGNGQRMKSHVWHESESTEYVMTKNNPHGCRNVCNEKGRHEVISSFSWSENSVWPSRCFGNLLISKPIINNFGVHQCRKRAANSLRLWQFRGNLEKGVHFVACIRMYMDATERWCQNACGTYVALDLLLLERGSAISQLQLVTQIWLCPMPMPSTKTHIDYTVNKSVQTKVLT